MGGTAISRRTAMIMGAAALAASGSRPARAARTSSPVPVLAGYVGDYFPFDTPQILPRLVIEDASGSQHGLGFMAGRIVLLNFWATWCVPCLVEMLDLDRLQADFSASDFSVLALCTDQQNVQSVSAFLSEHGLHNLGIFLDPTGEDLHNCAITAVPTSFIIDRFGRARGMLPGPAPWDSRAGRALVSYYLAESPGNASTRRDNG
jgi:thiol-disulfide isomerase/thioredoxin